MIFSFRRIRLLAAIAALFAGGMMLHAGMAPAKEGLEIPLPTVDEASGSMTSEVAILAGGCFWGVQGVFQHVRGVTNAVSGYAGGDANTAQYETVSSGTTGHAESVKITFDPKKISY